eukprot:NODE_10913_length_571_cov_173.120536_g10635_i0.p1 GENE.NODE_10913_length_571_cov_173.120536_g10635_i0~~NODE_10913_length_571_cov_173.120536_g10635_i0.p1  ORF type:complete len:137 (+),score=24.14 NODE_10913_length_571_cov_173.120536_g10635_i0:56-412(+)
MENTPLTGSGTDWNEGLFGCLEDPKLCIITYCFPVCQLAHIKATLEDHPCGVMDLCPLCCCVPCYKVMLRGQIRERAQISGSLLSDLLVSWFCGPCALTQEVRELRGRGFRPSMCLMD